MSMRTCLFVLCCDNIVYSVCMCIFNVRVIISSWKQVFIGRYCCFVFTGCLLPYSGKYSRDKIFADGSKNENSRIKFSRMLARIMRQNSENA